MNQKNKSDQLRQRAERLLAGKENLEPAEHAKNMEELVESLQIYQFELEIQNEELVRVQQLLEKSNSRFESLFNNAPVAYCILNLEGVIQEANHSFISLLAPKSNELTGKNLSQFIDHLSQDDFYLHLRNAMKLSQGYISTIVFNSNGEKVYVKLHSQLEQLIDGDEMVMLCTLNDITSEVSFSAELSFSEKRFRSLVTSLDDVVFTLDTQQRHTGVYGKWLESTNQIPDDYIGKTSEEILGRELALIHQEHNRIALGGKNVVYEWSLETLQGTLNYQTSLSPIYDSTDQVIGIAGVARDITDLRDAHTALTERHNELNCLYSITALGNDLHLLLKNYMEECIKLVPYGFTRPENTAVRITVGNEVCKSKNFKETRSSLTSNIKVNNEIIGKIDVFSNNKHYSERDEHFIDEEKSLLGAIADHISYIIKRSLDGEEINQQNDILKRLNAEKDRLFSVIGHDLRGPLSSIIGFMGILESNFGSMPPEKGLKILKGISQTASNIYQLLENLLEWAGFQKGTMAFSPQKVSLLNLVESVLEFFEYQLNAKQIYSRLMIPEGISVKVDENMVLSTLRNLISNAIKFSKRNGEISITAEMSDNGNVVVAVADNGIGMEPKILENLFNIEYNVGREGTEKEPSSGLGLMLCKGFIEKHGGKIWVESEVGKGSIFYFSLPVA